MNTETKKPINFTANKLREKGFQLGLYDKSFMIKNACDETLILPCHAPTDYLLDITVMCWNTLAPEKTKIQPAIKNSPTSKNVKDYFKKALYNCAWELLFRQLTKKEKRALDKIVNVLLK